MNIFEKASRTKLRFPTDRGNLTVEQLWDLPLTSEKSQLSLNGIGMGIQTAIREMGQDSLVDTGTSPGVVKAQLSLDLIKHVIAVKQAENAAARDLRKKKEEKQKLLEILDRKEDSALEDLTPAEIQKRLEALGV